VIAQPLAEKRRNRHDPGLMRFRSVVVQATIWLGLSLVDPDRGTTDIISRSAKTSLTRRPAYASSNTSSTPASTASAKVPPATHYATLCAGS
jgi:hypothetical protein